MTEFKKRGSLHRENSGDYQSIFWIFTWNLINRNNNVAMGKSNPKMIRENNSQNFYWARNDSCSCRRKYKISAMMGIKQSAQQDFAWLRKQNQSLTKGCSSSRSNDWYLYKGDEAEAICLWCSKQLRNLYVFVSLD